LHRLLPIRVASPETIAGQGQPIREPLRCLWLTRRDPRHPDAGDLSYSFHLITHLAQSGVKVTVAAATRPGVCPPSATDGVEWSLFEPKPPGSAVLADLRSLVSPLPNIAARHKSKVLKRELYAQLAKIWDVIVIDHLGMGWTWPLVAAYRRRHPRAISLFVAHGYEGELRRIMARNFKGNPLRRAILRFDALKARFLERKVVSKSTMLSVITPEDRISFGNSANITVITPGYAGTISHRRTITSATPRRVLMFGSVLWLAKQMNLLEFIHAADQMFWNNGIELWVVGRIPDHLVTKNLTATRFLGFVSDPRPIFDNARIGIVAERTGGGFKLKTLDYVFSRLPMAAITGSIAGLPLTPGLHFLSFDSMQELAEGVCSAIDDLDLLNSLQEAAFDACKGGFSWIERARTLHNAMLRAANREIPLKSETRLSSRQP
jgi:polysaccharide biosynthesis protein PslH